MVTKEQKSRGTHVILERGDYLILCGFAGSINREIVLEIDRRGRRVICEGKQSGSLIFKDCEEGGQS